VSVRAVMHFVDDPEATAEWWAAHFGGDVHVESGFAWFERDGVEVGFHPADPEKNPKGGSTVVYWRTNDLDEERERLIASGCTPLRGPLDIDDRRRICQLTDPFGIVFGLDSGH
jgi:predicted enzyme related to lactoylglutathione lyase